MDALSQQKDNVFPPIEPGAATIEFFDLEGLGIQLVVLVHAQPGRVPRQVAMRTVITAYTHEQAYVVRVWFELRPLLSEETLVVSMYDHHPRQVSQLTVKNAPPPYEFEVYFNPTEAESRSLLQILAQTSTLNLLLLEEAKKVWGKIFPWTTEARAAIQRILAETENAPNVSEQAWQEAKHLVMDQDSWETHHPDTITFLTRENSGGL